MEKIEDHPEFERDLMVLQIITENSLNEFKKLLKIVENCKTKLTNLNEYEIKKSNLAKIFAIKELNEQPSNYVKYFCNIVIFFYLVKRPIFYFIEKSNASQISSEFIKWARSF